MKSIYFLFVFLLISVTSIAAPSDLSIADMSVDGLTVKNLKCHLDEGNFLSLLTVVTSLAQQKDKYAACGLSKTPFDASWTWGAATKAEIAQIPDAAKGSCAKKALQESKGPSGNCSATIIAP